MFNNVNFWYEDLLLDNFSKKIKIKSSIILFIIFFMHGVVAQLIAYITWNFDTKSFIEIIPFYISMYLLIIMVFYFMKYVIYSYKKMLQEFEQENILDEKDTKEKLHLKNKLGLNIIRIPLFFLFMIYFIYSYFYQVYNVVFLKIQEPNLQYFQNPIYNLGPIATGFSQIWYALFFLILIPDFVSFLVGILFYNMNKLAKTIKLSVFNNDNCWGINKVGNFVLLVTFLSTVIVILIDGILFLLYIKFNVNKSELLKWEILTGFWIVFPWIAILLIFFIPQISFRLIIEKEKKKMLSKYNHELNLYANNFTNNGDEIQKFLALNQIVIRIKDNSNWPFNMSTFRKFIGFLFAPTAINIILIINRFLLL